MELDNEFSEMMDRLVLPRPPSHRAPAKQEPYDPIPIDPDWPENIKEMAERANKREMERRRHPVVHPPVILMMPDGEEFELPASANRKEQLAECHAIWNRKRERLQREQRQRLRRIQQQGGAPAAA